MNHYVNLNNIIISVINYFIIFIAYHNIFLYYNITIWHYNYNNSIGTIIQREKKIVECPFYCEWFLKLKTPLKIFRLILNTMYFIVIVLSIVNQKKKHFFPSFNCRYYLIGIGI